MLKRHRITQGDSATLRVPLFLDGAAAPIAGWQLVLTVKESPDDADPGVLQCTADNGRVTELDAYAWRVKLPAAATKALTPAQYYYDLQGLSPAGEPQTLERGHLIIDPEITQA